MEIKLTGRILIETNEGIYIHSRIWVQNGTINCLTSESCMMLGEGHNDGAEIMEEAPANGGSKNVMEIISNFLNDGGVYNQQIKSLNHRGNIIGISIPTSFEAEHFRRICSKTIYKQGRLKDEESEKNNGKRKKSTVQKN